MTNRNYDFDVACLLGLDIVQNDIYILCDCRRPLCAAKRQGDIEGCAHIVPFYHKYDALARQALEQVCDERKLQPEMYRTRLGWWRVWLVKTPVSAPAQHMARGVSKNFSLAICRALVGLGEQE